MPKDNLGLPRLPDGGLDPTGNMNELPTGQAQDLSAIPYGMAGTLFGESRNDLNPLNSLPARTVRENAKRKLNEHLRSLGKPVLQPDESPPALSILIELTRFTQEPLRTDAYRAMKDMQVPLCTSQEVMVKWGRTPYKAVPYEVRQFPIHVADMILTQIQSFLFIPVRDDRRGIFVGVKVPPGQGIRVSHKPFRAPKEEEIKHGKLRARAGTNLTSISSGSATGSLLVDLDPSEDGSGDLVDASGVRAVERDGETRNEFGRPVVNTTVGADGSAPKSTSVPLEKSALDKPPATGLPAADGEPTPPGAR